MVHHCVNLLPQEHKAAAQRTTKGKFFTTK
jgi:hypothetical protein